MCFSYDGYLYCLFLFLLVHSCGLVLLHWFVDGRLTSGRLQVYKTLWAGTKPTFVFCLVWYLFNDYPDISERERGWHVVKNRKKLSLMFFENKVVNLSLNWMNNTRERETGVKNCLTTDSAVPAWFEHMFIRSTVHLCMQTRVQSIQSWTYAHFLPTPPLEACNAMCVLK